MWKQGLDDNAVYLLHDEAEVADFILWARQQELETEKLEKIKIGKITRIISQHHNSIGYNDKSHIVYAMISGNEVLAARRLDDLI